MIKMKSDLEPTIFQCMVIQQDMGVKAQSIVKPKG